ERNYMYAENVEHRRCPYAPRNLRMIELRTRSRTNITTSPDWPHPAVCAAPKGRSDSGVFAVPEGPVRLSSQFATITRAAWPTGHPYCTLIRGSPTTWVAHDLGHRSDAAMERWHGDQRTVTRGRRRRRLACGAPERNWHVRVCATS